MSSTEPRVREETLDPQDWEAVRELGHRMVDDMLNYLAARRDNPVWQPTPEDVKERLQTPLPSEGQDLEAVYEDFMRDVLPYIMGNTHPRFWGWVMGPGTPTGVLAEMLASAANPNMGGGDHSGNRVEAQVLDWCKQMLGYPAEASGILVTGGSMANLVGLTVARNVKAGFDVRQHGLQRTNRLMTLYTSREAHSSIQRAVEVLGLGSESLRQIPVNTNFEIDIAALEAAIASDRAAGHQPIAIIGNAGTVNTGAFDDLNRLAEICAREGLWYHVDGAFGALAALSPSLRPLTVGMERADSIAFDLHKWLYVPFEAGCALVRNADQHRRTFTMTPEYLKHGDRGLAAGSLWYGDLGIQLSRGFRALKVWMSIKEHGIEKYGRLIQQNVDQARYLGSLVDAAPELERIAPVSLNIVCFRFKAPGIDDATLNKLNEEILVQLHESGIAVPSGTTLNGKYCLRAAITNHRSRREDFDLLVSEVLRLGKSLVAQNVVGH